jgi:hypothetical protein
MHSKLIETWLALYVYIPYMDALKGREKE